MSILYCMMTCNPPRHDASSSAEIYLLEFNCPYHSMHKVEEVELIIVGLEVGESLNLTSYSGQAHAHYFFHMDSEHHCNNI